MKVKNKSAHEVLDEVKRLETQLEILKPTDLEGAVMVKHEAYDLMKAWIKLLHPGIIT